MIDRALFKALEVDELQHFTNAPYYLLFGSFLNAQTERYVLVNVEVRKQRVPLKYCVYIALVRRYAVYAPAVKEHVAARRLEKARDNAERGRFSAAGGSQKSYKFLVLYVKVNSVEYLLPVIKVHHEVF